MPLTWVDVGIVAVASFSAVHAARSGLVRATLSLTGFFLSLSIAFTFYVEVGDWGSSRWPIPPFAAQPLAFAVIWLVAAAVTDLVGTLLAVPLAFLVRPSPLNAVLAGVPGILRGLTVAGFGLALLSQTSTLPADAPGTQFLSQVRQSIRTSRLAGPLIGSTETVERLARGWLKEPLSHTFAFLAESPLTPEASLPESPFRPPSIDLDLAHREAPKEASSPDATAEQASGVLQERSQLAPAPAPVPLARDPRFGLNQAWEDGAAADRAGAGWSRLVFWWGALQPKGPNDWNTFATDNDSYINAELARGRELTGVILNTPTWAGVTASPNAVPRNLYLPWDHPQNYWGQFMRRLATRYAGKVNTWIIWNEVDIPSGAWQTWDGSIEDYVQLLRVAYRAVKAGNPQARIAHYGSPWWYDRGVYLSGFLDLLVADPDAPASNYYFDIGNLHLYSRANDIAKVVPWYRAQLASRGIPPKPIWIGETNAVPYDDRIWPADKRGFRASMDEQASYILEALATYIALEVERVGINRLKDGADFAAGGEPFGLLRNDGSARPAFKAFQVAARIFAGSWPVSYHPTDQSGLTMVVLERIGERITVAWTHNPQPQTVKIGGISAAALRVTKYGDAEVVHADGSGLYWFELAPATANSNETDVSDYVVGGDPLLLVERFDGGIATVYPP